MINRIIRTLEWDEREWEKSYLPEIVFLENLKKGIEHKGEEFDRSKFVNKEDLLQWLYEMKSRPWYKGRNEEDLLELVIHHVGNM